MPALTFTPPEYDAFIACWEAGHEGMPDHRWIAVELALGDALGDLEGVDVDLDGQVLDDAKKGFAAGWEGFMSGTVPEASGEDLSEHMEAAAVILDLLPAPGLRH